MNVSRRDRCSGRWHITWLLLGSLLGLVAGLTSAREYQIHAVHQSLDAYADSLLNDAARLNHVVKTTAAAVVQDGQPPCSDADLAFMRDWVFQNPDVRDIGRTTEHELVCSSNVGRVDKPLHAHAPDLAVDGKRIFVSIPLLFSSRAHGFVVEMHDVAVVLNPAVYNKLDRPPLYYGAWLYVAETGQLVHSFGHEMPLTPAQIMSSGWVQRHGVLYRSRCSRQIRVCVVGAEPVADLFARGHQVEFYFGLLGAVLGGVCALILVLYVQTQLSAEHQLRRALQRNELTLEYQPIVELTSGRVVAAEALIRWTRRNGEVVRPPQIIELAEQRGVIRELTRYVVQLTLREMNDVLTSTPLRVTVNITAHDLDDPEFPVFLERALVDANVLPGSLGLELTERSTARHTTAIAAIETLRRQGHFVSIDDFGTGYSSLSYLHELNVDAIKVDRSFTRTVGTGAVTASVVPQILAMAAQLGLQVVVEGIETEEQAAYFHAVIAPPILGQGWLYGKAMPADRLREMLAPQAAEEEALSMAKA